ncbi:MAG: SUMF1/EgtB/PvdO family nonheme iron enzyme [Gammaproteobacteria bacterium]|nr:SUMF1/EgtB/PvdO family nonheme iron enzyme [Gammaproteobacteria bacterium]
MVIETLYVRRRSTRWRCRWLWWLLLWPMLALAEPRTALVVGNAHYENNPLRNPVNDARDLAEALRAVGFEVLQKENLDQRELEQIISDFARRLKERGGVGLFYYSGHGIQVAGQNYLIPINAPIYSEADVKFKAVNIGQVLSNMEQASNGLNIVVLDACRDNPYRGWYRGEGHKGLVRMDAPTGSIIAYATAPGTVAADGTGRNSPYTAQLLRTMRTPGIGIEQLLKRVRIQVAKATDNRQVPWESSSLMGDFFFVPSSGDAPPPAVAQASVPSPFRPSAPNEAPAAGSRPAAGQVFQDTLSDGTRGPKMVVIGAGEFQMGSPESEAGREPGEAKERRHRVKIGPAFALGQFEVTVGEFKRFVEATGYWTDAERDAKNGCWAWSAKDGKEDWRAGLSWRDAGYPQKEDHPVVCVSWTDAQRYVTWLSERTGQVYRLPSEAEWEYAARAGTTSARYWGDDPEQACQYANGADQTEGPDGFTWNEKHGCKDGYWFSAPVGSFRPNDWKLYDVLGNVWEWTCSAYAKDYDGSEAKCANKDTTGPLALRGGSWLNFPAWVRSANRFWGDPAGRVSLLGFRLARSL